MELILEHPLIVPLGLGFLGLNVVCWLALLFHRPVRVGQSADRTILARALLAEGIGSFALLFVGVLTVIASPLCGAGPAGLVHVALAHGLALTICLAGLGHLSGGQFNPAVTFACLCTGRLDVVTGAAYLVVQVVGATLATGLLGWLFGPHALLPALPMPSGAIAWRAAFVLEAVTSFVVMVVVFGTMLDPRGARTIAPAAVGSSITVGMLAIGPLTGGALNPLRYLAPALTIQRLDAWLVYTAGPLVGALLAAALLHLFTLDPIVPTPQREEEQPATEEYPTLAPRRAA